MLTLKLDLLQTLSLAAALHFIGLGLRRRIGILNRLNIPAPVVSGLLFALLILIGHDRFLAVQLDTAAQPVLFVAFFTTIGMGASLALLRRGGGQVIGLLLFGTLFCLVQNFLGIAIAQGFVAHPLLGVMAGSVTLVGGPGTGMAFAPLFEEAGLTGRRHAGPDRRNLRHHFRRIDRRPDQHPADPGPATGLLGRSGRVR